MHWLNSDKELNHLSTVSWRFSGAYETPVWFLTGIRREFFLLTEPILEDSIMKTLLSWVVSRILVGSDQYDDQYTNFKEIKEKFLISCEIRNFLVETTGLEPVTSCVWRSVWTSNACCWALSGTFCSAFSEQARGHCLLCPPADIRILVSVLVKTPAPPIGRSRELFSQVVDLFPWW